MPNYAPFPLVAAFPDEGLQMGRTLMLRMGDTDVPFILRRVAGVNLWRRVLTEDSPVPPAGPAGGVLGGFYPNPDFAEDMTTQAEFDTALAIVAAQVMSLNTSVSVINAELLLRVLKSRMIATMPPLAGGGDLTADRMLSVAAATTVAPGVVRLATNGESAAAAVQGTDGRLTNARPTALPVVLPSRLVVAAYAIVQGVDYHIACNMTVGPYAVTLPATPANGERYEVTKALGAGVLTVNRNGNPMDGQNVNPSIAANHTATFRFTTGFGWISTESDVA